MDILMHILKHTHTSLLVAILFSRGCEVYLNSIQVKGKRKMINVRRPTCMTVTAWSDLTSTFTDKLPEHLFNWPFYYLNNKKLPDTHLILSHTQADILSCSSFAPFAAHILHLSRKNVCKCRLVCHVTSQNHKCLLLRMYHRGVRAVKMNGQRGAS